MPTVRVHHIPVSLDGWVAGPGQDLEHPLGVAGERLHESVFRTRSGPRTTGAGARRCTTDGPAGRENCPA